MKIVKILAVIAMTALVISCHKSDKAEITTQDIQLMSPSSGLKKEASGDIGIAGMDSTPSIHMQAGQPAQNIDWDKKIIKTAHVKLDVKDYHAFDASIHSIIKRYGAYTASERQTASEARIENDISIKVPVAQFEDLMSALPGEGITVLEKNISTEDVTGEVVDTKARMEAKKAVRSRYLELMKQAKNMKDVLEVQGEIDEIQETIESGTGRVDYLVHQAAYSTININYFQVLQAGMQDDVKPTFFSKLREAFTNGSSIVSGFLLLLVSIWPLWTTGLLIWLLVKRWKPGFAKLDNK